MRCMKDGVKSQDLFKDSQKIKKVESVVKKIHINHKDSILSNIRPLERDGPYVFFQRLVEAAKLLYGEDNAWGNKEAKRIFQREIATNKSFQGRHEWGALFDMVSNACYKLFTLKDVVCLILQLNSRGAAANFFATELFKVYSSKLLMQDSKH